MIYLTYLDKTVHYDRHALWFFVVSQPHLQAIPIILQNLKWERFSSDEI